jgi:hypothetical protein
MESPSLRADYAELTGQNEKGTHGE